MTMIEIYIISMLSGLFGVACIYFLKWIYKIYRLVLEGGRLF